MERWRWNLQNCFVTVATQWRLFLRKREAHPPCHQIYPSTNPHSGGKWNWSRHTSSYSVQAVVLLHTKHSHHSASKLALCWKSKHEIDYQKGCTLFLLIHSFLCRVIISPLALSRFRMTLSHFVILTLRFWYWNELKDSRAWLFTAPVYQRAAALPSSQACGSMFNLLPVSLAVGEMAPCISPCCTLLLSCPPLGWLFSNFSTQASLFSLSLSQLVG